MTDPISSLFLVAGLIVLGCLSALGVILWRVVRSVQVSDQLCLPLTAEEYAAWDDAVIKTGWRDESPPQGGWGDDITDEQRSQ